MPNMLSDPDLERALAACADEPVHIPGTIQPFGWLLAYDSESGKVDYVSENISALLKSPVAKLFGLKLWDLVGSELWHAVQNALINKTTTEGRVRAGQFTMFDTPCDVNVFKSGKHVVVEFERVDDVAVISPEALHQLGFLIDTIQVCQSQTVLFETTTKLVQLFSGYDRVMVYQFDKDFNGEVLAEARRPAMASMNGLRFPHWDIPVQARKLMQKLPLRIIADIEQQPVPISAANSTYPAIDITHANSRGVSPVHLQYLRNMGSHATMTLSVVLDGQLWGIISFHHRKAKTPSPQVRYVLQEFRKAFQLKLNLLRERLVLKAGETLDVINNRIHDQPEPQSTIEQLVVDTGPKILELIDAQGIALLVGSKATHFGRVPGQTTLDQLASDARDQKVKPLVVEHLLDRYPHCEKDFNGCAGALAITYADDLTLFAFREELSRSIQWAGNPEKTVETVEGLTRLAPRGSFSRYLEEVTGRCEPWSNQDIHLFKQLWTLLSVADRRSQLTKMNRQQALMIDELNHRVRNILALIRAVSSQARSSYGSLSSYSKALEARISSLAAVHDIGSGSAKQAISVARIIRLEAEPYQSDASDRVMIEGIDRSIRADLGPIFALVIHELMTNAAKYGALSTMEGRVRIEIDQDGETLLVIWKELYGPSVEEPSNRGFGTALIEQAVPYELGGSSAIYFERDGVRAEIRLPNDVLGMPAEVDVDDRGLSMQLAAEELAEIPKSRLRTRILVVEDNFMIASDMRSELERLGFESIELCSGTAEALEYMSADSPELAFLDINLGGGETSEPVATKLQKMGVPFAFVTGYGERAHLPEHLSAITKLTKPASAAELQQEVARLLNKAPESPVALR